MAIDEPILAVNEIQGNVLRGFRTNHLHLAGYKIVEPAIAKPWIAAIGDRLTTLAQVHQFRLSRSQGDTSVVNTVLLNIAFSFQGIKILDVDVTGVADGSFRSPMGSLARSLGDRTSDYVIGKTWLDTPDILFILGSDDFQALTQARNELKQEAEATGLKSIYAEYGSELPGGIEHFGYRDGISQPGARGRLSIETNDFLTLRQIDKADSRGDLYGKPGQPLVWPGQFVFGYPTQLANSPLLQGPKSDGGMSWMLNGSYLVFRRLRQNVRVFNSFLAEKAVELSVKTGRNYTQQQLGAILVGRWSDGTPLVISPEANNSTIANDEMWVNHFGFRNGVDEIKVKDNEVLRSIPASNQDRAGQRCPFFAHIRKVNPRDSKTDQDDAGRTLTLQMLRRGIPYGPLFVEGENEETERGLLFLAYQTSFKRQFNILNNLWMNNPDVPEKDQQGHDMLVGQNLSGEKFCSFRDEVGNEIVRLNTLARWVIPTGGAFLFSPSISFFRILTARESVQ